MIFCTKCGVELKKSWKHCPSCGEVAADKATISSENSKLQKETKTTEDASPSINDVLNASIKNISVENSNSDDSSKKLFGIVASIVVLGILVVALSSNSSSDYSEVQMAPAVEVSADPEAEKLESERNGFSTDLATFLSMDCKPEITKKKGNIFYDDIDNIVFSDMTLDGIDYAYTFPARYINQFGLSSPKVDDWGNQVDKTLIIAAAYEKRLAPLYYEIYDMWNEWGELGKYKSQFDAYFKKVNRIATSLCYNGDPLPTDNQFKSADKYINELIEDWLEFNNWVDKVWAREAELSDDLDYETTPRCTETKTNNPDYNIVTCTNLP
jgi:hypothetical protein